MRNSNDKKSQLLKLLRERSVFYGSFKLSSGATSNYYVDCRLTTFNPEGALLVGQVLYEMINEQALALGIKIDAVGGLTMGADPVALAIGIASVKHNSRDYYEIFSVRKSAKTHGQNKLIEGNFREGNHVVVIDDVITRGDSTLQAIQAVEQAGGTVEFVTVLVDRQEGGTEKIEAKGYKVLSAFSKNDLLNTDVATTKSG